MRQRVGTVLALLALLSQMVISLLPMPAFAADGTPICSFDGADHRKAPATGGSQTGHRPDCPVCQAAQLLGSLVPPTPIAVPVRLAQLERADLPVVAVLIPHRAASRHQARAPPSEV